MYTSRKYRQPTFEDVRNVRLMFGLTQAQCAELIGINERNWQRYESGDGLMPRPNWYSFCRAVGYPRDQVPVPAPKTADQAKKKRPSRPKNLTPEQHAELQRRIDAGESITELAAEFHVSRQTIYNCCEIPDRGDRRGRFAAGAYPAPKAAAKK